MPTRYVRKLNARMGCYLADFRFEYRDARRFHIYLVGVLGEALLTRVPPV